VDLFLDTSFLITNFSVVTILAGGTVAITVVYCSFNLEERRHALHVGVWIGVPRQRLPGPIVLLNVLDGRALMAVRQQPVQLADIVVVQFQVNDAHV
jgi:hypothetical protein